jgi:hypothetical protein
MIILMIILEIAPIILIRAPSNWLLKSFIRAFKVYEVCTKKFSEQTFSIKVRPWTQETFKEVQWTLDS